MAQATKLKRNKSKSFLKRFRKLKSEQDANTNCQSAKYNKSFSIINLDLKFERKSITIARFFKKEPKTTFEKKRKNLPTVFVEKPFALFLSLYFCFLFNGLHFGYFKL